ncbi:MAG: hypothetical protein R2909_10105 [Gemmatimonadales bacterium]
MRAWVLIVAVSAAVVLSGCGEPLEPAPTAHAFIRAGDRQIGATNQPLPILLEIAVRDQRGRPVAGAPVRWGSDANGRVEPIDPNTDRAGNASARWVLGATTGPAEAYAVAAGDSIAFHAEARVLEEAKPPLGVIAPLGFATFDGSGEVVHPDFALVPERSAGRLLALTPYPNGNAAYELPSLFESAIGVTWRVPAGVVNPLVPAPAFGHLSDPDLVRRPDVGDLWLYYRAVIGDNTVLLTRSSDGVSWSAPRAVVRAPNHELLSPSVVYRGPGDWLMWSVNGEAAGCSASRSWLELRRSVDGEAWGAPVRLRLEHDGLTPWHVDVQWIPDRSEYWALYNAKQPGSCTTPALFLATSPNGTDWTPIRRPVLVKGALPIFEHIVYRSTFHHEPGSSDVWLWYSGARFATGRWVWRGAVERRLVGDLLAPASDLRTLRFVPPPSELIDWP